MGFPGDFFMVLVPYNSSATKTPRNKGEIRILIPFIILRILVFYLSPFGTIFNIVTILISGELMRLNFVVAFLGLFIILVSS